MIMMQKNGIVAEGEEPKDGILEKPASETQDESCEKQKCCGRCQPKDEKSA